MSANSRLANTHGDTDNLHRQHRLPHRLHRPLPKAAGRVSHNPTTQHEGNASNPQEDPQPTEEQRENAIRDHFGYLHDNLPEEISVGSNNSNRLEARISVSAVRHGTRKRREEQIERLMAQSKDEDEKQSRLATVDPNTIMVISSSDEDEKDTEDEEETPNVPDLVDTDNTD